MNIYANKTAVVTGAGSGIGRALARELAARGAKVIITDIVKERVDSVVKELEAGGARAGGYVVDHSKKKQVADFTKAVMEDWGLPDVLCLNAGVAAGGKVEELTQKDWDWTLGVNLYGPIYMIQRFVPEMVKRKSGMIMITASGAGLTALPGLSPYSASKYAMVGLCESLHCELYKHNIHVTALCPGVINTGIVEDGRMHFYDGKGASGKDKVRRFYAERGTDPSVVARQGLDGLAKNRCIQPSPFHVWPMYMLKRVSPALYQRITRFVWKKGWLL